MKENQKMMSFFAIVMVGIFIVIGYFIIHKQSENYNYLKVDSSKNLVYTNTKVQHGMYYQYTPYLNLKGDIGVYINSDIHDFIQNYDKDNVGISYENNLNGEILSLILIVEDHSYVESATVLNYRSYNIHLGREEMLSDEVLLGYYDLSGSDVENIINIKLDDLYQKAIEDQLINHKCNFQCFLKTRDFTKGVEDVSYIIRDGKLIGFKPYTYLYSNSVDEDIVYDFEIAS